MECTCETCLAADTPSPGGRVKRLGRSLLGSIGPIAAGYDVLRILLAALLLTAAGLKAYQLSTEPTLGTGLLDSRWLLIAAVEFELFFGLWLLANILPRATWAAAVGCFSVFTCISLYKALSGYATCGCFGRVAVNPWYTASFDLTIVCSLLYWRPCHVPSPFGRGSGGEDVSSSVWSFITHHSSFIISSRASAVLLLWLAAGLPAGYTMCSYADTTLSDAGSIVGNSKIVVLEPENWVGKQFPLLDYIDVDDRLRRGRWVALLYHHSCPDCRAVIRALSQEPATVFCGGDTQVALLEMPPYGELKEALARPGACCVLGQVSSDRDWFVTTPAIIQLSDGEVMKVHIGAGAVSVAPP